MNVLKSILLAGGATVIMAAVAQAADLPTKKSPPAAPAANCYATFMTWLDSTPADCPLSIYGITLYGQVDVGGGYQTNAASLNKYYPSGTSELIMKENHGARWQFVPNGLSQSNVGIKVNEHLFGDVSFVGDVNFGFDPYSLQFANGPASLQSNNLVKQYFQTENSDSSRAGGLDNSRGYAGFSSPTFGTLTAGRQNSIETNLENAYDPLNGAYAFSMVGGSSTLTAGDGDTETARYNTSIEYIYDYQKMFHVAGIVQLGGYDEGNGAQEAYQLNIGGSYAGFSLDGVYAHAKDAVALSAYGGIQTPPVPDYALKATLANIDAFTVLGKYQWQQFTFFGAYQNAKLSNPSDKFSGGISNTIGGYEVIPSGITNTAYTINKIQQTAWVGAKYSMTSQLDFIAAYYEAWQNNYSGTSCVANTVTVSGAPKGTSQGTNTPANNKAGKASGNCDGTEPELSFVIDYRPWKRVDTYAGIAYSEVTGGLANGFIKNNNTAFTAGVRVSF